MDVPATNVPETGAAGHDSQESIDIVPESPPLFTQSQKQEDINIEDDDMEAEISDASSSDAKGVEKRKCISLNSMEDRQSSLKGSDVIIEMECDDEENLEKMETPGGTTLEDDCEFDFPDDDDSLLLSAVTDAEESVTVEPGILEELELIAGSEISLPEPVELTNQLKEEEAKRRTEVEKFRKFKPLDKVFPDVRCSEHNTVSFFVKPNYKPGEPLEPNPANCVFKWEPKFVTMPFNDENTTLMKLPRALPSENENGNDNEESKTTEPSSSTDILVPATEEKVVGIRKIRVWQRIKDSLSGPDKIPILCSQDFVTVFKSYCRVTTDEFKALDYCIEQILAQPERVHFFQKVVPFMVSLVLQTSEIVTCPIPLLRKNVNHNISLSQKQVACLLANAFFSTFPRKMKQIELPSINFKELFAEEDERVLLVKAQKIRCLINYFTRVESEMPQGAITYTRKNLRHSSMPDWGKVDKGLTKLVPLLQGTIEDDGAGMLQVDFANSIIGGGVLGRGAVQEEILFVIYPELIITRLFTEKLNYNEAVIVTGCERFSNYQGYSFNFRFDGDHRDSTLCDSKGRRCTQIVAIDALYISRPTFQYHPKHIVRELNKAYVGFHSPTPSPVAVATGKWGCGAFNGDPQLKTIIQLLAASHAGRDLALFTFGDVPCLNDILSIYESIREMKIKEVWNLLRQYHSLCCSGGRINRSLRDFCVQYATSRSWVKTQEQARQSPSTSKRMKAVPLTHFYPSDKPERNTSEDASVTAIINGMDHLKSPTKRPSLLPGKRQREEEPRLKGLSENEIQEILDTDNEPISTSDEPTKPTEKVALDSDNEASTSSPKSPKRQKRLIDFYPLEDTG